MRFDAGLFSQAGSTPAGGLRLRAHVARTGVQAYTLPDGTIRREYRPAEEVGSANSLASYVGAPLTIGHPARVSPANFAKLAIGHVSNVPNMVKKDADDYVETFVDVNRDDALRGVTVGDLVELSAGYSCDFDPEPGVTSSGEKYDGIQRNIRINHIALLPVGKARAGRKARLVTDSDKPTGPSPITRTLRLDADGNQTEPQNMTILIGGKTLEGAELQAAVCHLEAELASSKAKADAADKSAATAEGKLVVAEKARDEAAAKAAPAAIDALVADELAFRDAASKVLGEKYDFSGKARRDVKCEVVKARLAKDLKADDSDVRVDALYEVALDESIAAPRGEDYSAREPAQKTDATDSVLSPEAWSAHLASLFSAKKK